METIKFKNINIISKKILEIHNLLLFRVQVNYLSRLFIIILVNKNLIINTLMNFNKINTNKNRNILSNIIVKILQMWLI